METDQDNIIQRMLNDKMVRTAVTKKSHFWFFHLYFSSYIHNKTADFQREMFKLSEDENVKNLILVAFRGSAKSTIMTTSYPIWSILGKPQKKFVLILGRTQQQAKQHLLNLKYELDKNDLLRNDLGPFEENSDEWGSYSLVLSKYNAKIMAASSEQSIRGIRHRSHRPDLIICDDIEDLASIKNLESRDKIYQWLTGEIIPAGDEHTKLVIVGNLLHKDSLLMRLKKAIEEKRFNGVFREYPFLDQEGKPLWPDRFKNQNDIETIKNSVINVETWHREYMLRIIPDGNSVILPQWIKYYDKHPSKNDSNMPFREAISAVDLAISLKETADYTAVVSAKIYGWGDDMKIYIMPNTINERLNFPDALKRIKYVSENLGNNNLRTRILVEEVAYQMAVIEQLLKDNYPAEGIPVAGQDKLARLNSAAPAVQNGTVLFPKSGAENLISQLLGFGTEKHDDLADAFAMLINKAIIENKKRNCSNWPELSPDRERPFFAGMIDERF